MAEQIPGARLVKIPGDTHGYSPDDPQDAVIFEALHQFMTGERPEPRIDRDGGYRGRVDAIGILILAMGNDRIIAERGDDEVFGGPGNDTLAGRGGADIVLGARGEDALTVG